MPLRTSGSGDHVRIVARSSQVRPVATGARPSTPVRAWPVGRPRREVAERRQLEPGSQVALAVAEDRQVDRQDDRPVAGRRGALDERPREVAILLDVELEPAGRLGGRGRHLLDGAGGHRRERERHTGRGRGPRRRRVRASGCASAWIAIGAIASGSAVGAPSSVVAVATRETSTSTRGRNRRRRQAASFSARVISSHEPPAM